MPTTHIASFHGASAKVEMKHEAWSFCKGWQKKTKNIFGRVLKSCSFYLDTSATGRLECSVPG